jgi:predicted ribosomally synthesized peptide with SipW-like signal peptide
MSHRAVPTVLALALATGLVVGATWSAFTDQTSNGGNTFTAAASSFGPEFVKQLGTGTCDGNSSSVTVPAGGAAADNTVVVGIVLRGNVNGTATASDSRGNT